MNKPSDFMHGVRIYHFGKSEPTKVLPDSKLLKPVFFMYEKSKSAKCYELQIPEIDKRKYGVKKVKFYFFYDTHKANDVYVYYNVCPVSVPFYV